MLSKQHKSNGRGIYRIKKAFICSLSGLRFVFINEAAFRQELLLAVVLFPFAFIIGEDTIERLCLIGTLILLLVVEIINSAIEVIVDRISTDIHPLSKHAKDLGSAAVFLMLLMTAVVWLAIAIY